MAKPKRPSKPSSKKPKNPPHSHQSTQPAPSSSPTTPAAGTGSQPTPASKKPQPVQPQFITIADAAKRLGISEKTIRRWIDRRKLPAVRMGSQLRIPIGAFLHFIGGLPPARP
jgi:excisionase family DNA binding protein